MRNIDENIITLIQMLGIDVVRMIPPKWVAVIAHPYRYSTNLRMIAYNMLMDRTGMPWSIAMEVKRMMYLKGGYPVEYKRRRYDR